MTNITAIELENFQSIEKRTRIELKPITLLYGPNSAGKSTVFDALELLRVLLDPLATDESKIADMLTRWARNGEGDWRTLFIAVEFPFDFTEPREIWDDNQNWPKQNRASNDAAFFHIEDGIELGGIKINDQTVRIEMQFKISKNENHRGVWQCLDELACFVGSSPIMRLGKRCPEPKSPSLVPEFDLNYLINIEEKLDSSSFEYDETPVRWLEIFQNGVFDSLFGFQMQNHAAPTKPLYMRESNSPGYFLAVDSDLSGRSYRLTKSTFDVEDANTVAFCRNAHDIMFYFGTMLWQTVRGKSLIVRADRRSPRPKEALTIVDPGLSGWWPTTAMAPSSPARLLKTLTEDIDEHFKGLAEVAHAALLLRAADDACWGDSHAKKHIEPLRARAKILDRVNHHLESSLFSEKLYKVECASTLMVPIDLEEDAPWSYYALAQPAVVRLFLKESSGASVELQDVGSGVSYVLPVLYALSCQGLVQVQQPELHLHPALQAAVADVFIEELHRPGRGQFLIETHSEHLLLRFLRRIRDTEKGKALSDDVKLTNDDIAVYYFDPTPGGGTFVSRQLVTPLGDFYNDWPRGFFTERRKDLFDEE